VILYKLLETRSYLRFQLIDQSINMSSHINNNLSHGELMAPNSRIDSDPMLPNIRTSLHTTYIQPDPTPSDNPEMFDKSTGHPNSHYDHSKTLSKKKRAKMYGTGSPQLTSRPSNMKVDRTNALDDHDAHEKVDHNKARDDYQEAWDHGIAKSKDATISGREDEDLMTKRDEVSQADKPDLAAKDPTVTTSDANKKKFADKSNKSQDKSDKSQEKSDKSDDKSDKSSDDKSEDSSKPESMLGRAANLASGLLGSVKETVANLTGKSSDDSSKEAEKSKQEA